MINYTLTIPTNKKVSKNNSNVVGSVDYKSIALPAELQGHLEKAYIYSRIESQGSFRPFFYACNKALFKKVVNTSIITATYFIVILL